MIEPLLQRQLEPAVRQFRRQKVLFSLLLLWTGAIVVVGGLWLESHALGFTPHRSLTLAAIALCLALGAIVWTRASRWQPDYRQIARNIELRHPELHALLVTAVEQRPSAETGQYSYLQQRVIQEAIAESLVTKWADAVPENRLALLQVGHWSAFAVLVVVAVAMLTLSPQQLRKLGLRQAVEVSPGDTVIERGSPLVVLARFDGRVPAEATLLVDAPGQVRQHIPLVKNLEDPTFGGTLPEVGEDLLYSVIYDGKATAQFTVRIFDYPRLERADARVTFPSYTGKPETDIKDTRRISAVEGSRLQWTMHLNKPVSSARLVARDNSAVPLLIATNDGRATLNEFVLQQTKSYRLELVDSDGRTNKVPAQFVFEALTNRRPEIKLAAPRGDQRPSSLEEIAFAGQVWDDFGLKSYGITYTVAGKEPVSFSLGESVPAAEKRAFEHLLKVERLNVIPDQLVSWFVWADDVGPDGAVRRTSGDMYFAEIRPFEEIFRPGEGMGGMSGGGGGGTESLQLADLQKQIINATWKLQRREQSQASAQFSKDAAVVLESQQQALEQAQTLKARSMDPRVQGLWTTVEEEMTKAVEHLTTATNQPPALPSALSAEQSAYQALLKIAGHEFLVARNSNRRGSRSGGGEQRNQRQLDQLEFKGEDNRYETQSEASPTQSAEQREQLGVLTRLKELAQRQEDLNERLKELQTALQEAKTEIEREELRRELKRLREEEQDLLADVDDLMQRMSQPQNQAQMADSRRELEKTREDVQRAAEALSRESVPEALTSGTRAERELEQLRDDFRKKNSSQFAEDMRQMRSQARELARQQQEIGERLNADSERKSLSASEETKELADQLQQQQAALTNLLQDAQRVSEQAETSEPLLSKQLYDTLRRANQDDASRAKEALSDAAREGSLSRSLYDRLREIDKQSRAKSLEAAAELLRNNLTPQARSAEQRARADLDNFKRGLEKAAESVLGDDTEALRLAKSELEELTQQIENELARNSTNSVPTGISKGTEETNSVAGVSRRTEDAESTNAMTVAQARTGSRGERQEGNQSEGSPPQQSPGENRGQQGQTAQSQSNQEGNSPGEGNGQQQSNQSQAQAQSGNNSGDRSRDGGPFRLGQEAIRNFFNSAGGGGGDGGGQNDHRGPLTGETYRDWSERLGNVEEMVDNPELRSEIARIRDRARNIRSELKRHAASPQWPLVQTQIIAPLNEVRTRVAEELARRQSTEALVPIDRDPVPNKFSELVRRYYEKLGQD
jgi:hypothetical protein